MLAWARVGLAPGWHGVSKGIGGRVLSGPGVRLTGRLWYPISVLGLRALGVLLRPLAAEVCPWPVGLTVNDVDIFEINEAFASQVSLLAAFLALGCGSKVQGRG